MFHTLALACIVRNFGTHTDLLLVRGNPILGHDFLGLPMMKMSGVGDPHEFAQRAAIDLAGVLPTFSEEPRGTLVIDIAEPNEYWSGFVLRTEISSGNIRASSEAKAGWFDLRQLPFREMLPGDDLWLPLIINGSRNVTAHMKYRDKWSLVGHHFTAS